MGNETPEVEQGSLLVPERDRARGRSDWTRLRARDAVFVFLLNIALCLPFIGRSGYHFDDWGPVRAIGQRPPLSLRELYDASFAHGTANRPVQSVYAVLLLKVFGTQQFGFILCTAVVFGVSAALLYFLLVRLGLSRIFSLAAAITFSAIPHYSTDRLWFAAVQASLGLISFLVVCHADLSSLTATGRRQLGLKMLSAAAIIVGVLAYEIFLGLLFVEFAALSYVTLRRRAGASLLRTLTPLCFNAVALLFAVVFKVAASTSDKLDAPHGVVGYVRSSWRIASHSLVSNYFDNGALLPHSALRSLTSYFHWEAAAAALLVTGAVFEYLRRATKDSFGSDRATMVRLWIGGIALISGVLRGLCRGTEGTAVHDVGHRQPDGA